MYQSFVTQNNFLLLKYIPYGRIYWRIKYIDNSDNEIVWNKPLNFNYLFRNGSFETGDFEGWIVAEARENSITVCNSPVKTGNYAAKINPKPEDIVDLGPRAEISTYDFGTYKKERFYSWDYMFDSSYIDSRPWQMIMQFHDQPNYFIGQTWQTYPGLRPPLSILYSNGIAYFYLNIFGKPEILVGKFNVKKGVWFNITFKCKWSMENDGYTELYVDGNPITPFNGTDYKYYSPNCNNIVGNFLKIGLYRDKTITTENTVYVDNLKFGKTKDDLN